MSISTGLSETETDNGQKVFTLQELAQHDGQNGTPAYLAIHGIVYDVTRVKLLKDGLHHDVLPGKDVSDLFIHNNAILNRLPVIGKLG